MDKCSEPWLKNALLVVSLNNEIEVGCVKDGHFGAPLPDWQFLLLCSLKDTINETDLGHGTDNNAEL